MVADGAPCPSPLVPGGTDGEQLAATSTRRIDPERQVRLLRAVRELPPESQLAVAKHLSLGGSRDEGRSSKSVNAVLPEDGAEGGIVQTSDRRDTSEPQPRQVIDPERQVRLLRAVRELPPESQLAVAKHLSLGGSGDEVLSGGSGDDALADGVPRPRRTEPPTPGHKPAPRQFVNDGAPPSPIPHDRLFEHYMELLLGHRREGTGTTHDRNAGDTYRGIAQFHYDAFLDANPKYIKALPAKTPDLSPEQVEWYLKTQYYDIARVPEVVESAGGDVALGELLFDFAVNSDLYDAVRYLQRAINDTLGPEHRVAVDTRVGPQTRRALAVAADFGKSAEIYDKMLLARRRKLIELAKDPEHAEFAEGWLDRLDSFPWRRFLRR